MADTGAVDVRGYRAIKAAAQELGVPIGDLLALSRNNDPFFAGSPANVKAGEWFADLWSRFGYSTGVHLRRIHYQVLSTQLECPDGAVYENTERCWGLLEGAAANARALGLVTPDALVDRRNPPPTINAGVAQPERDGPSWSWEEPVWHLPAINADIAWNLELSIGEINVEGYEYDQADQPVLLEVWVEKSTMNDVLGPLCAVLGVNLVSSLGFQSITSAVSLLVRAAGHAKPARVLYISDFDPAGERMPVAMARQVEFWHRHFAKDIDLKITPLVLTQEQVETYDLPRTPIKVSDRRRAGFEERRGEGAVELDALEALHPGVLAQVVRQAVQVYRDPDLAGRLSSTGSVAKRSANDSWQAAAAPHAEQLERIRSDARRTIALHQDRLSALAADLDAELAPLRAELDELRPVVERLADEVRIELPQRPSGETTDVDESGWLFDAGRDYFGQLAAYRSHKLGGSR